MNQKGGAALERLAEIRNHHLPPEGFAKERAAQHAAATQMQATFRGHHQRSEAQRIHDEEVTRAAHPNPNPDPNPDPDPDPNPTPKPNPNPTLTPALTLTLSRSAPCCCASCCAC